MCMVLINYFIEYIYKKSSESLKPVSTKEAGLLRPVLATKSLPLERAEKI